jgi:hypothetical protein
MITTVIKDLCAFSTISIAYLTYIELNPKTKGIVFRPNDKNEKILSIQSIKSFILFPLTETGLKCMWSPNNWDINFPFVTSIGFAIYKTIF